MITELICFSLYDIPLNTNQYTSKPQFRNTDMKLEPSVNTSFRFVFWCQLWARRSDYKAVGQKSCNHKNIISHNIQIYEKNNENMHSIILWVENLFVLLLE